MLFDRLALIVGNGSGTTIAVAAFIAMLLSFIFTTECFTPITLKMIGKR